MSAAIYNTVSANIDVNTYNFRASGQNLKFKGFMTLYVEVLENEKEEVELSLPELEIGATVIKQKLNSKQSFTAPPPRYTEASLVKALEEKGIGRPSTYSPTITTILERRYIEKEQKQLMPTELGKVVNKLLVENFPNIIDVEFTAKIEEDYINNENINNIRSIVNLLNEKDKYLYNLYFEKAYSQVEIAKILKKSQSYISREIKSLVYKLEKLMYQNGTIERPKIKNKCIGYNKKNVL